MDGGGRISVARIHANETALIIGRRMAFETGVQAMLSIPAFAALEGLELVQEQVVERRWQPLGIWSHSVAARGGLDVVARRVLYVTDVEQEDANSCERAQAQGLVWPPATACRRT